MMELGSLIMFGSVHTEPRPKSMQISIGSVHILSVSGSMNEALIQTLSRHIIALSIVD